MIHMYSQYRLCASILCVALAIGILPVLFNFIVDPYRMHGLFDLGMEKRKIATRNHGPLFKIIDYPRQRKGYLLFGDSRSRALRNKLFHELGFTDFYNFAYRGGTMAEAIDSFLYALEHAEIKGIAIGVPLRSMSKKFSKGKNQVPEAVKMRDRPTQYFTSNFVADTGIEILDKHYPKGMERARTALSGLYRLFPFAPAAANAEENSDISAGYCKEVCSAVSNPLWEGNTIDVITGRRIITGGNIDLLFDGRTPGAVINRTPIPEIKYKKKTGISMKPIESLDNFETSAGGGVIVPPLAPIRVAPANVDVVPAVDEAWRRRVEKGGKSDWKAFDYSEEYYQGLKKISEIAKKKNIKVVFFIPPAHADMQAQVGKWDRRDIYLEHRRRIARLGPILDYDVPTETTNERANFTDPYHFKANVARAIAMDLITQFDAPESVLKTIKKRRKNKSKIASIYCPADASDPAAIALPGEQPAWMGRGCILWERHL